MNEEVDFDATSVSLFTGRLKVIILLTSFSFFRDLDCFCCRCSRLNSIIILFSFLLPDADYKNLSLQLVY